MKNLISKLYLYIANLFNRLRGTSVSSFGNILAFTFSFLLVFSCLYITAQRGIAVKKIRSAFPIIISSLNEMGLDISYHNIKFNPVAFFPLVKIEKPQIYSLNESDYWSVDFDNLKIYSSILHPDKIYFNFSSKGNLFLNNKSHSINAPRTHLTLSNLLSNQRLDLTAKNIDIGNFGTIKKILFTVRPSSSTLKSQPLSYEFVLQAKEIDLNELPYKFISSKILRFDIKASSVGKFAFDGDLLTSTESWVKDNGFIDIQQFVLQWPPLTLVGKGDLKFNDDLQPRINLNTSSQGLLNLLKNLQDNSFIDNSNVYVANILLNNKAFKLNSADKELTITTPISYYDGKISIENLVIKDFNPEIQQ